MKVAQLLSRLRRAWRSISALQWTVLAVLIAVAIASTLTATLLYGETWGSLLLNFGTETAGAVVTYVLLQMIIGTSARKETLIAQMGSDVRDVAVAAAEELRRHGWLTDGSLRAVNLARADLQRADLKGAYLERAFLGQDKLQEANLLWTNLQGAILWFADLQEAILARADLRGGDLRKANLQGAILRLANLQGADLRGANLSTAHGLDLANLDGAKANSETKWPEGLQVPDTVETVED